MNLEQIRAQHAFEAAAGKDAEFLNLARSLPQMLRTNGLLATWAFLLAKGKGKAESPHQAVLKNLASHLRSEGIGLVRETDEKRLLLSEWTGPQTGAAQLQRLTAEAIAYAGWLKRASEALSDQEGKAG